MLILERLKKQLDFLTEIDKLKHIVRKTKLPNSSRFENDAEHAWHLAMMALILGEHANREIDICKVIKMVLIHDIVEIDAGDIIVYDREARQEAKVKEQEAARRIFGLLPADQGRELLLLWQEFEARESAEAKFAAAIDRFQPIIENQQADFYGWRHYGVNAATVKEINRHIGEGSELLWDEVQKIFSQAIAEGALSQN